MSFLKPLASLELDYFDLANVTGLIIVDFLFYIIAYWSKKASNYVV